MSSDIWIDPVYRIDRSGKLDLKDLVVLPGRIIGAYDAVP